MLLNARALGAGAGARPRHVAALHRRQDDARDPVPAAAGATSSCKAKPFVDVTVDRVAKALGALLLLVLIKPWGLHLDWQQLSYASLTVTGAVDPHGAARAPRATCRRSARASSAATSRRPRCG